MKNELILGIAGLIISVLTYFAGVYRTEKRYKRQERSKRIDDVVNRYMEFRKTNKTSGLDALQKSAISNLKSDAEIREVLNQIINYGERDPLKSSPYPMDDINLKTFFDEANREKLDFFQSKQLKQLIDKIRKNYK